MSPEEDVIWMRKSVDTNGNGSQQGAQTRTSPTMLRRLIEQDGTAWKFAHAYYGGLVYRWCRWRGCSIEVADEIAQETLLRALQNLPSFEHRTQQVGGFRAWLRAIASNLLVEEYRQSIPVIGARDSSFHQQTEPIIDDGESLEDFVSSLLILIDESTNVGEETARHFVERIILGLEIAEISAEDPTLKPDTVYRHVVRTAKALSRAFNELTPQQLITRLAEISEQRQ